jgi:signal transduction histidine kinase
MRDESDQQLIDDRLLSTVCHELRNPLTAIRTASEVLRVTFGNDTRVQRACAILERQTLQMAKQLDNLSDVARLSRGALALDRRRIDLGAALERAVTQISQHDGTERQFDTAISSDLFVDADPARVSQILEQILGYATKRRRGTAVVHLSAKRDGSHANVTVGGVDVDPSALSQLALSRGLVALHGGEITATAGEIHLRLALADPS